MLVRSHPVPGTERRCGITIGTVKTLVPEYGIDRLIQAFARLYKAGAEGVAREITLEITGDGPQRAALELLASTLGVAPAVTFHGAVAHDQVPAMLARLDVFVAFSQTESFGRSDEHTSELQSLMRNSFADFCWTQTYKRHK